MLGCVRGPLPGLAETALSTRDNLRVKEVTLERHPTRRWVTCLNPAEAERDKTQRDTTLDHIRAELERIKTLRDWAGLAPVKPSVKAGGKPLEPAHVNAGSIGHVLGTKSSGVGK